MYLNVTFTTEEMQNGFETTFYVSCEKPAAKKEPEQRRQIGFVQTPLKKADNQVNNPFNAEEEF
ncbi:MAG: hypothetical protein J6P44_06815 [Bacteroidales bacterium]|nr:hypothetical protein [Bacteroidales bacterium]